MPPDIQLSSLFLTRFSAGYVVAVLVVAILSPSALTLYLYTYAADNIHKAIHFHEIVISLAIAFSAVVSAITWQCYRRTGRVFQRWLLFGLVGFTVVYAPHGLLTATADHNLWLFILYGPASRLLVAGCFLMAVIHYGKNTDRLNSARELGWWLAFCAGVCVSVFALAYSPIAGEPWLRWSLEGISIALSIATLLLMRQRRINNALMLMFAMAIALFAQSSLAFALSFAWSDLWWYAHIVFAAGFLLLSYGVVVAYRTTGSFETVYSQAELLAQLRQANENYRRSNTELANFAHLASHDLQAPLRQLGVYVELLDEELRGQLDDSQREYLDYIAKGAAHMRALVQCILALSNVGKRDVRIEQVDLDELLGEVAELLRLDLDAAGGRIRRNNMPVVEGDRVMLFQLFQNLLQNAIKYRRPEVSLQIDVSARGREGGWCIAVADNGSGFDMAHKDKVFSMFGRLHAETVSGTGAGMAICRKIVERHGGELDVEAEVGKGATFFISLPGRQPR